MMQNKNVVVKKVCHPRFCRPQDSGISTLFSSSPLEGEGGTQCRVRGKSLIFTARSAFTLIELLVVVLIIGILAAVAVPQYQKAVWKSRYIQLMTLVPHVYKLQEIYYLEHGEYAANCAELAVDLPNGYTLNNNNELYSSQTETTINCGNNENNDEDTTPNRVTGSFPGKLGWLAFEYGLNHASGRQSQYFKQGGKARCWGGNAFAASICNSLCGPITGSTSGASCYFK